MRHSSAREYQPVNQRESVEESEKLDETPATDFGLQKSSYSYVARHSSWIAWTRWLPWILIPCLVFSNGYALAKLRNKDIPNEIFSPASPAIRYKNVRFQAGIDSDTSPYQGPPSEESDRLWEELHKYGVSKIPMSDAAQLANRTAPIAGDLGDYVVVWEVFHQLHCLSHMRRRLYLKDTTNLEHDPALNMKHIDHCIESIRQSLMCSADVTPLPYVWWSQYGEYFPSTAVMHTCRDFDALVDWAKERRAPKVVNQTVQVYDPLGETVEYDV